MRPFFSTKIPLHMAKMIAVQKPLNPSTKAFLNASTKALHDFVSAMGEARARLSRSGPETKASTVSQTKGSPACRTKESAATLGKVNGDKKKDLERPSLDLRDLAPVAVLLRESGIPQERTEALLNSLISAGREAGFSAKELPGRVRSMIISEKGGDGMILLDPGSRLRVESALTEWGLSPKEADRVISLSSTAQGKVDVEKFIRLTVGHRASAAEKRAGKGEGESDPLKAGRSDDPRAHAGPAGKRAVVQAPETGRQVSDPRPSQGERTSGATSKDEPGSEIRAGASGLSRDGSIPAFKAGEENKGSSAKGAGVSDEGSLPQVAEKARAKQGLEAARTVRVESAPKPNPLSVQESSHRQARREDQAGRNRAGNEAETSRRSEAETSRPSVKEVTPEEAWTQAHPRTSDAGPIPHQAWTKPAGTPSQPPSLFEHPVPGHVVAQVSRQVSRALLNGDQTVRLNLNPPQLGTLKVRLEWSGERLKIEMLTDRPQVKDLLLASTPELKEALGQQGFKVDKMEVQMGDLFGQAASQSGPQHRDATGAGFPFREENAFFGSDEKASETKAEIPFTAREDHLIDLVA
jgi:hypothetical protein